MKKYYKALKYCFFTGILFFSYILPIFGQGDEDVKTVVVKQGQNVRDLAEAYLDDPNLWMEILRVNGLKSPADVKPDMSLKIPVIIIKAKSELKRAQEAVNEASKTGARVSAPDTVAEAIRLQNDALARYKESKWDECFQLARSAAEKAGEAVEKSKISEGDIGEAILSERKGMVQSRKPSDQVWNDLPLNSVLLEGEKVRTLSEAYAEIRFKDGKRIRLTENSQIVISKAQSDVMENKEASSVSLTKGDAYVLLEGKQQSLTPDKVQDTVSSGKLLLPPELISPVNGTTLFFRSDQNDVTLEWNDVADASAYWLEIAADRAFKKTVLNQKGLRQSFFGEHQQLKDGMYYWRVAAVNSNGFPGTSSRVRFFRIINDNSPPYLVIHSPMPEEITAENPVKVIGEAEQDATVSFDGKPVGISGDGIFRFDFPLTKGENEVKIEARDKAGNVTALTRSVVFSPNTDVPISYDAVLPQIAPKHFITRYRVFNLTGETEPKTAVSVHAEGSSPTEMGRPGCFADDSGRFQLNLPLTQDKTRFILSVTSPGGHVTRDAFVVERDNLSPDIRLNEEPPEVMTVGELHLKGNISEESTVSVNGKAIPCMDTHFDALVRLAAGTNSIQITAQDKAGNFSFLERKVILDQQAPNFLTFTLSAQEAQGGESLGITVSAEDESGLEASAEFGIRAGDYVHTGFLKLNKTTRSYQGTVNLPPLAKGRIGLDYVKLADYMGNKKTYQVGQGQGG